MPTYPDRHGFASRPRLLIADEPTTALDVTIQACIVRLIAEMQKRDGTAVVFITHDLRLASQISELTLENDFLSGALGKAGLLGGKK